MVCERCRIREANIKYTEVINGVKTEHNLCSQCAQEMDLGPYSAILEGEFPLGKLISSLLGLSPSAARQQKLEDVACPTCGTTYEEFVKNSRFGCADCYHVFDLLMGEKIRKIQENASHTGKHPKMRGKGQTGTAVTEKGQLTFTPDEQIRQLERRLQAALKEEDYEEAAVCRDAIRALRAEQENAEQAGKEARADAQNKGKVRQEDGEMV